MTDLFLDLEKVEEGRWCRYGISPMEVLVASSTCARFQEAMAKRLSATDVSRIERNGDTEIAGDYFVVLSECIAGELVRGWRHVDWKKKKFILKEDGKTKLTHSRETAIKMFCDPRARDMLDFVWREAKSTAAYRQKHVAATVKNS